VFADDWPVSRSDPSGLWTGWRRLSRQLWWVVPNTLIRAGLTALACYPTRTIAYWGCFGIAIVAASGTETHVYKEYWYSTWGTSKIIERGGSEGRGRVLIGPHGDATLYRGGYACALEKAKHLVLYSSVCARHQAIFLLMQPRFDRGERRGGKMKLQVPSPRALAVAAVAYAAAVLCFAIARGVLAFPPLSQFVVAISAMVVIGAIGSRLVHQRLSGRTTGSSIAGVLTIFIATLATLYLQQAFPEAWPFAVVFGLMPAFLLIQLLIDASRAQLE
jgi:hypothetical protein